MTTWYVCSTSKSPWSLQSYSRSIILACWPPPAIARCSSQTIASNSQPTTCSAPPILSSPSSKSSCSWFRYWSVLTTGFICPSWNLRTQVGMIPPDGTSSCLWSQGPVPSTKVTSSSSWAYCSVKMTEAQPVATVCAFMILIAFSTLSEAISGQSHTSA